MEFYMLDEEGNVKKTSNALEWGTWLENDNSRFLKRTDIGNYYVSTVFLGLDYSFRGDVPVLCETMTFNKEKEEIKLWEKEYKINKECEVAGTFERYTSKEDALKGHDAIVELVKGLT